MPHEKLSNLKKRTWERKKIKQKHGEGDPKCSQLCTQRVFFLNFSPKERHEIRWQLGMWQQPVRVATLSLPLETTKSCGRSSLLSGPTLRASTCSERHCSLILLNHAKLIWGERLPTRTRAQKRIAGKHDISILGTYNRPNSVGGNRIEAQVPCARERNIFFQRA